MRPFTIALAVAGFASAAAEEPPPQFMFKWGAEGFREGQLDYPVGIAVDTQGSVFVADFDNDQIQNFDSNGTFISLWCSLGKPYGMAIDNAGNVYFTHYKHHRVAKHDSQGNSILDWGSQGAGDGQFYLPHGIAVDLASGNVYVADPGNHRIQKFDATGSYLTQWPSGYCQDVAVDSEGHVYVSQLLAQRIVKSDGNGTFLVEWFSGSPHGVTVDVSNSIYVVSSSGRVEQFDTAGTLLTAWGTFGSGDGEFNAPHSAAIATDGTVYVADNGNHRVQVFAPVPVSAKQSTWSRARADGMWLLQPGAVSQRHLHSPLGLDLYSARVRWTYTKP